MPFKQSVENGTAPASWTRDYLMDQTPPFMKGVNEESMYLALSIVLAGSDNTRMVLNA